MKSMKWIGLTGGIASGKSTVSEMLKTLGVPVVDADKLAHQALKVNQDLIVQYFGSDILDENNRIDRKALGARIFTNPKNKKMLENIIHPYVQKRAAEKRELLQNASDATWAVYDIPLLFEKNRSEEFDRVVVVFCSLEQQKERLMKRNNLTEQEASDRLSVQLPLQEKKTKADDVIENTGTLEELKQKVLAWKKLIDAKYSSSEDEPHSSSSQDKP